MRYVVPLFAAALAAVPFAPAASADDVSFGFSLGSHDHGHGHRRRRHRDSHVDAFLHLDLGSRRPLVRHVPRTPVVVVREPVVVAPTPECREAWIPETVVWREQVVTEPAAYETRYVPVYDEVEVPVYEDVVVPVEHVHREPAIGVSFRASKRLRIGLQAGGGRHGHVVGHTTQRVQVGTRVERVQVGTRPERVLVRPATQRVVSVPETVPGRWVLVCDAPNGFHPHAHAGRETMTSAEYEAALGAAQGPGSGASVRYLPR